LASAFENKVLKRAGSKQGEMFSLLAKLNSNDYRLAPSALVFVAAIAIACFLLWFIMVGAPPNNY